MILDEPAQVILLTAQEIEIVNQQITNWKLEIFPHQQFFARVVDTICRELSIQRTVQDIAHYVQSYITNQVTFKEDPYIKEHPSARNKILTTDHLSRKYVSIFKQFADFPSACKLEEQQLKHSINYVSRSKRKIKPTDSLPIYANKNVEVITQFIDSNINDCNIIFQKKSKKYNSQKQQSGTLHQNCMWIYNEYFYSNYDRAYFREEDKTDNLFNELGLCIGGQQLENDKIRYKEHRIIRMALPRPKMFNNQFLNVELDKLYEFRRQLRNSATDKCKSEFDLTVGKDVIALHPVCGHLHSGTILAIYKQNQYMVKFMRPELGTQKVVDINMLLKQINNPQRAIVQNVDYQVMALTIKLLQYKSQLLKLLKQYNFIAQNMKKQEINLQNKFLQEYGWIGSTISIVSLGIRHIISKFRMRGINQANQQKIGKNFASILLNPLNLMEKQLDKSSQNADVNASNQIKRIISNYRQNKTQIYTQQLFNKNVLILREAIPNVDERIQMEKLLRSVVGLLVNLKYQIRNFNIEKNRYVDEIQMQIDRNYPQYFNEIYQTLHTIVAKANQAPLK